LDKIKSKKSYNIDFEDLLDDNELSNKKCKKKKKKKKSKKNKHKSSKKSSNLSKKERKKIKNDIEITSDFFGLTKGEKKQVSKRYDNKVVHRYEKSLLGRIADSVNLDAKINVDISDDTINNLFLIASGLIAKIFIKK
jgi:hypothetical protein